MSTCLLKIDNKLLAVQLDPFMICNISNHLHDHTIRKIIYNCDRFIILTITKLFYLYRVRDQGFKFIDITDNVSISVNICDIKFVSNSYDTDNGIVMFTNNCKAYDYDLVLTNDGISSSDHAVLNLKNKHILAASDDETGYIYKRDNKYVIEHCTKYEDNRVICRLDNLPLYFMTPCEFLYNSNPMDYGQNEYYCPVVINTDVTHIYNKYYYVKNNLIYNTNDEDNLTYGKHKTDDQTVLTIYSKHKIVSTTLNKTNIVEHFMDTGDRYIKMHQIACSYYCADNLGQYSNDTYNIIWGQTNAPLI